MEEAEKILGEQPYQPSVSEAEQVVDAIEGIRQKGISYRMLTELIKQRTKLPFRVIHPVLNTVYDVCREVKRQQEKYGK